MIPINADNVPKKMGQLVEENIGRLLDEGYFKSYPTDVFQRTLEKFLKSKDIDYIISLDVDLPDSDKFNDYPLMYLQTEMELKDQNKARMEKILEQCGWYIADSDVADGLDSFCYILEPKFPIDNSKVAEFSEKIIQKYKTFYHISFRKYEEKILKNGLVPSLSKRNEFNHPERVYLFSDSRIAKDFIEERKQVGI